MSTINRKVCIFTEGGSQYGYGHLTRCIALYDELINNGYHPIFIINGDEEVKEVLKERDSIIDTWYNDPIKYLKNTEISIVDSYKADSECYKKIADMSSKAIYIDDNNRIDYPKGIIVNPSVYGDKLRYNKVAGQKFLLGSKYIIVRKGFSVKVKKDRKIKKEIENSLIIMGGSDVRNLTPTIMKALNNSRLRDSKKHIVIGKGFSNIGEIKKQIHKNDELYYNLTDEQLCRLMKKCDLAITAAGQTIYELITQKLPFVLVKTADNQDNNISGLLEKQVVGEFIDGQSKINRNDLINSCIHIIENESSFINRNRKFYIMKDIQIEGVGLIIKEMESFGSEIKLRKIRNEDLESIMNWRMSKEVSQYMFTDPLISFDQQQKWFEAINNDKSVMYWMIDIDGAGVGLLGLIDIDSQNKRCNRVWYIGNKQYRGLGIGKAIQLNCNDYVFNRLSMNRLYCEILSYNKVAINVNLQCGLKIEGEMKEHVYKNGIYNNVTIMGITATEWNELKLKYNYQTIEFED